jgi:hypothetical protein
VVFLLYVFSSIILNGSTLTVQLDPSNVLQVNGKTGRASNSALH